jgi:HAE1 family hydrophobic/amphiphilic exporter-1
MPENPPPALQRAGMTLPELSIKRHVFAYMLSGVLLLFGAISFDRIGVDRYPNIDFPMVSIRTILPGASPEIIDSSIANIIEGSVNSLPGIRHITSTSAPGVSVILVQFGFSKDVDVAFNEVQAKVNQVLPELPQDADPPVVAKVEFGATPILWLALTGDRTLQQLNRYARSIIKKRLETIDGIGEVKLGGERKRTIRVNLDPNKMAAFGIAANDVIGAFATEHVRLQGGFLVGGEREELVKLDLEFHDPRELESLIVAYPEGAPIRLADIGEVVDGIADHRQFASFNGEPTVGLGIVKVHNSNTVAIVDEVKRRLAEEIIPELPPGMRIDAAYSDAELIEDIVFALEEHIVLGTLLTALVVFLFLKSLSSTLIIAAAIPVSLLGAVAVMYFSGYTFNTMTLLGLLLLIGIVVDDAIVVLENIYRQREGGNHDPVDAAIEGSRQVVFAVLAATLTLVAIFAPVIFMEGVIGRFFESFAVVVTVGVLVSLFVSLTLTPALCARFLGFSDEHGRLYQAIESGFQAMDRGYRRLIVASLRHRWSVIAAATFVVMLSGVFILVKMARWEDREISQVELMAELQRRLSGLAGLEVFVTQTGMIGGDRGDPLRFKLHGPNLERVAELAYELKKQLDQVPGMGVLDLDLQLDLPQLEMDLSRERIRSLGLTARDVALAVNVMSGGLDVARYNDDPGDGERYDVRLKAGEGRLQTAPDLSRIYLRTPTGELVRLDNLVQMSESLGPAVVARYDLQYAATFNGTPEMAEAAAINKVQEVADAMLPVGYKVTMFGRSEEFGRTAGYMLFAFITAIILVYMVLASQFNSFIQPFVIMVAQPLAIIGGVAALWLTGNSLNIFSMIGLVLLVGLVAKNSILLVDLTNQMREEGLGIDEALVRACPIRMRPVLMTSLTIILALSPAALGLGAGSDTNGPLAVAVIGGLVSSTLLTLVVVPSAYSLVEHKVERFRRPPRRRVAAAPEGGRS